MKEDNRRITEFNCWEAGDFRKDLKKRPHVGALEGTCPRECREATATRHPKIIINK